MLAQLRQFWTKLPENRQRILLCLGTGLFLCLYSPINQLAGGWSAASAETALDAKIPFLPGWVFVYALLYLLLPLPMVLPSSLATLRRICAAFLVTTAVSFTVFLLFPVHMDLRPEDLQADTFATWILALIHRVDTPANCLPSLHVSLSLLAALCAYSLDRTVGRIVIPLAIVVAFSTLFVKQHWLWDMLTGWALGFAIWALMVRGQTGSALAPRRRYVGWLIAGQVMAFGMAWVVYAGQSFPL